VLWSASELISPPTRKLSPSESNETPQPYPLGAMARVHTTLTFRGVLKAPRQDRARAQNSTATFAARLARLPGAGAARGAADAANEAIAAASFLKNVVLARTAFASVVGVLI
jgi:hypothetical protein